MKYAIYDGSIVQIRSEVGAIVNYISYSEEGTASKNDIIILSDEMYKDIQNQHKSIISELESIKNRIYKLDEAYHTKKNALYQLWMAAREKETALVSHVIKISQDKCQKE